MVYECDGIDRRNVDIVCVHAVVYLATARMNTQMFFMLFAIFDFEHNRKKEQTTTFLFKKNVYDYSRREACTLHIEYLHSLCAYCSFVLFESPLSTML